MWCCCIETVYVADFDLNLVRVFVLLYETRSVTATAEAVRVSQPTVSYSLGKLRRRFDDELFRRGRDGPRGPGGGGPLVEAPRGGPSRHEPGGGAGPGVGPPRRPGGLPARAVGPGRAA